MGELSEKGPTVSVSVPVVPAQQLLRRIIVRASAKTIFGIDTTNFTANPTNSPTKFNSR